MTGAMVNSLENSDPRSSRRAKPTACILSPVFAVAGGVLSGAVSGAVGLVSGLVAGAITGAKDVASAFTNKQAGLGTRIGKIAAAPLNLVAGPALAWKSLKRAVPQGLQDGWNHGPLRPIVNSTKLARIRSLGRRRRTWGAQPAFPMACSGRREVEGLAVGHRGGPRGSPHRR